MLPEAARIGLPCAHSYYRFRCELRCVGGYTRVLVGGLGMSRLELPRRTR